MPTLKQAAQLSRKRRARRGFGPFGIGLDVPPVTFPQVFLRTRVQIALDPDPTTDWWTWNWLDITERVRHDLGISVTAGRGDQRSLVTPSKCTIKLTNTDGALCRNNPMSPYYGMLTPNTPIWIQRDAGNGVVDAYHGYVHDWPPGWGDASGTNAFVTIQASGVMYRLLKGQVLRSPVFRSIAGRTPTSIRPIAYWSMEDGSRSSQFASAIPGVPAVAPAGDVSYAAYSDLPGSDPLPTFASGASCTFQVAEHEITSAWMMQMAFSVPSDPLVDTVIARIDTGNEGAIQRYDIVISPSPPPPVIGVKGYSPFGVLVAEVYVSLDGSGPANPAAADFYGQPWSIRVCERNIDGSSVAIFVFLTNGLTGDYTNAAGSASSAPCTIRSVTPLATTATSGIMFGHIGVHADTAFVTGPFTDDVVASAGALPGWDGEQAHERILRLCREEGIQVQALAAESSAMGPQGSGTLMSELRACELADQGFLYEWQFGIGYQALSERYNQPVRLELDFAAGHHAGVPQPADDPQRLVNKFTASRPGGSEATIEETDGQLGTTRAGLFPDGPQTVNVETDAQLKPYAGHRVWLGTVNEDRWPGLPFQLHRNPGLIPAWQSTPLGARVTASHPPSQMNPYDIDAVIEGYAERWAQEYWDVAISTSPYSPYAVGTLGDSTTPGSWPQTSGGTQLQAELASGGTSATAMVDGPLFTTDASDLATSPLSVIVGGEVMPVSDISSALVDEFADAVVSGWDVADSGQTWTVSGSASVSGGFGQQSLTAGQTVLCSAGVSLSDVDIVLEGTDISASPAGDNVEVGARLRVSNSGNDYVQVRTFRQPGGGVTINLNEVVGGSQRAATGFPTVTGVTSTDSIDIHMQLEGNTFRARAWVTGGTEPTTWQVELTVNHVTAAGDITVRGMLGASWSGASPLTILYDAVDVTNPQTFTVTRTLAKTHPAGSPLRVHRPLIAAY